MARQEQAGDHAWLEDRQYQTILRLTHTIAFEFDPRTGHHFVSPFTTETGDRLLRFIRSLAAQLVKKEETYGRIRDDVFGLCVCRSKIELMQLLRELRAALSEYPLTFRMTLSIGIYWVEDPAARKYPMRQSDAGPAFGQRQCNRRLRILSAGNGTGHGAGAKNPLRNAGRKGIFDCVVRSQVAVSFCIY